MNFEVGARVIITPKFHGAISGTSIRNLLKITEDDYSRFEMTADAAVFIRDSDQEGVFRIIERHPITTGYAVRLKSYRGTCKTGWWTPTFIFSAYQEDWLEDLPLGSVHV